MPFVVRRVLSVVCRSLFSGCCMLSVGCWLLVVVRVVLRLFGVSMCVDRVGCWLSLFVVSCLLCVAGSLSGFPVFFCFLFVGG